MGEMFEYGYPSLGTRRSLSEVRRSFSERLSLFTNFVKKYLTQYKHGYCFDKRETALQNMISIVFLLQGTDYLMTANEILGSLAFPLLELFLSHNT